MSPRADSDLNKFLEHAGTSWDLGFSSHLQGWFGCLATAVEYLHANKIRHRDIKPANILIYRRQVLLVDFGLVHDSNESSGSTTSGETRGTLRYAAPEVVLQNRANSSSDIWSLGCVFLEIATVLKGKRICQLRHHFKSQADNANFYNNERGITEWISVLEGLSDGGNAPFPWISKMLQRDRKLRPRAADIIDLIRNSDCNASFSNRYFCKYCQKREQTALSQKTTFSSHNAATNNVRCITARINEALVDDAQNPLLQHAQCISRSCIYWNPKLVRTSLPVQHMRSLFYPYFMVRHLTRDSMSEFTRWVVSEGRWDSVGVNVKLSCLSGRPLHLNVRRFVPSCHLLSHGKEPGASTLNSQDSLPVGIYGVDPELMAKGFNIYLDNIVDNNLMEYSTFLLRLCEGNHSGRILDCLFDWYYTWKKEVNSSLHPILEALTAV
jgi:serine/threonine protein kinase